MTSLTAAYDPAWKVLFGEFQLIPNLKPRPGQNPAQSRRRSPQRQNPSGGAAGMIANALLTNQAVVKVDHDGDHQDDGHGSRVVKEVKSNLQLDPDATGPHKAKDG